MQYPHTWTIVQSWLTIAKIIFTKTTCISSIGTNILSLMVLRACQGGREILIIDPKRSARFEFETLKVTSSTSTQF